jgi:hypothetical protein
MADAVIVRRHTRADSASGTAALSGICALRWVKEMTAPRYGWSICGATCPMPPPLVASHTSRLPYASGSGLHGRSEPGKSSGTDGRLPHCGSVTPCSSDDIGSFVCVATLALFIGPCMPWAIVRQQIAVPAREFLRASSARTLWCSSAAMLFRGIPEHDLHDGRSREGKAP